MNRLYYGDNLEVLPKIADELVDLVYLDPPFNSNRSYNVIFAEHSRSENGAAAQIQAFDDTWRWTHVTDQQYQRYISGELPMRAADALTAFRALLGENDAMAYLVNMAPRLVELHRVLKPTGCLYLHCDPTMSHYLKVLLDAIFGSERFRNEIIWKRTNAHSGARRFGSVHDVILFYARGDRSTWNAVRGLAYSEAQLSRYKYTDQDGRRYRCDDLTGAGVSNGETGKPWRGIDPSARGRHWGRPPAELDALWDAGLIARKRDGTPRLDGHIKYLDEAPGASVQDVITDIPRLANTSGERLGYPTQKPVALLERIIAASSNPGDVVLDPFCGCGTTIDAAQRLGRQWIGIDVTFIAMDLIEKRLHHAYGPGIKQTYEVLGIPRDIGGARALFQRSPFDFERWAVSLVHAQPNEKQVGDRGIDGVARFPLDRKTSGRIIVSVKGGGNVGPQFVRDLIGTVETQKAQMGVLITMAAPTRGIIDALDHGGTYTWPMNGQSYPRVQVITIAELLRGIRPKLPLLLLPYIQASRAPARDVQAGFDDLAAGHG